MRKLLREIESLKASPVGDSIRERMGEFESCGREDCCTLFKELCFCILTANFTAERSIRIQEAVGDGFINLSEKKLAKKLRELGHRFPNARAGYIVSARKHKKPLEKALKSFKDETDLRDWLAENVKGLGYKEASHFLRNVGFKNVAIIDFHIVDLLVKHELIDRPNTMTKRRYLEVEEVLKRIAEEAGVTLAELDLYLWYMETGRILK
ncbi:MAG: N-glycosylase/DNA lyase [Candidatus Altiarchaeales archaeon]|nr:N-glycosylase/DNA lyase [Candidatus Altiarchaeales archaeon]MBD3416408.1 N-glycosylase/DNA lyase [Candidatus Altiarchaeales archaeon]